MFYLDTIVRGIEVEMHYLYVHALPVMINTYVELDAVSVGMPCQLSYCTTLEVVVHYVPFTSRITPPPCL